MNTVKAANLKPCGICKSPGAILYEARERIHYYGSCTSKICPIRTIYYGSKSGAIAAWNRRGAGAKS